MIKWYWHVLKPFKKNSYFGRFNEKLNYENFKKKNWHDQLQISFKSDKYYDCYYSEKSEETFDFKLEEYPQCSKNQFRHRCKDTYVDLDGRKGVYVGEWLDDKKNGQGTLTRKNGNKYVGDFLDGNMHGQGTFTYPNGDKRVGVWEYGKPVE